MPPNSNSCGIRTACIYNPSTWVRQEDWLWGKFEAILGYTQDLVSKQDWEGGREGERGGEREGERERG